MRLGCTASLHPRILHHTVWKVVEEGNRREVGNGRKGEVIEAPLNYGRCRVR